MNTAEYYVEYKEHYDECGCPSCGEDNQQRYLHVYAESEKQIREMLCEYEIVAIDEITEGRWWP